MIEVPAFLHARSTPLSLIVYPVDTRDKENRTDDKSAYEGQYKDAERFLYRTLTHSLFILNWCFSAIPPKALFI